MSALVPKSILYFRRWRNLRKVQNSPGSTTGIQLWTTTYPSEDSGHIRFVMWGVV